MEVSSEEIDAALDVLRENFQLGGTAQVSDFVYDGQTPKQRVEGIRRLKEADELAEARVRNIVADSIRAAKEAELLNRNE